MAFWITQYLKSTAPNFGKINVLLYRSAQPDKGKLAEYKKNYGIAAVLNLRDNLDPEERAEVEAAGMAWFNIPMSDKDSPTSQQVGDALTIIKANIEEKLPTLVCCKGGRHRTGLIIAAYRVVFDGWDKKKAWKEAEQYGYYSAQGHGAIKKWFFDVFNEAWFRADFKKPR